MWSSRMKWPHVPLQAGHWLAGEQLCKEKPGIPAGQQVERMPAVAERKDSWTLRCVIKSIASTFEEMIIPLYSVISHLWSAVLSFGPPHAKDLSTNWSESNREQLRWLGAWAHGVPGVAEGAGLVQPELEKVCGRSNCSSPLPNGKGRGL